MVSMGMGRKSEPFRSALNFGVAERGMRFNSARGAYINKGIEGSGGV